MNSIVLLRRHVINRWATNTVHRRGLSILQYPWSESIHWMTKAADPIKLFLTKNNNNNFFRNSWEIKGVGREVFFKLMPSWSPLYSSSLLDIKFWANFRFTFGRVSWQCLSSLNCCHSGMNVMAEFGSILKIRAFNRFQRFLRLPPRWAICSP